MDGIDVPIVALSDIESGFYADNPSSRSRVLQLLPSLFTWIQFASRTVLHCKGTTDKIVSNRERFFAVVARALELMSSTGEQGMRFIGQKKVHDFVIDLWVQLRGSSVKEEESVAHALMTCRDVSLIETDDGTLKNVPSQFGKYFAERCQNKFDIGGAQLMRLARDRLFRALHPHVSQVETDRDFYLSLQLGILSMTINASSATYEQYLNDGGVRDMCLIMSHSFDNSLWYLGGHSIVILWGMCFRTQSTRSIITALKYELVKNLVRGTSNFMNLEDLARKKLTGFIERTLPESLIIRDVFLQCHDMHLDEKSREELCSHPKVGDGWKHLLQLYAERSNIFHNELPARHALRKCDNVRPSRFICQLDT